MRLRRWRTAVLWIGCTLCVLIAAAFVVLMVAHLRMRARYGPSGHVGDTLRLIYPFAAVAIPTLAVWRPARHRSRTRWVLKWAGVVVSATTASAFMESTLRFHQWGSPAGIVGVYVQQGCFFLDVLPKSTTRANWPAPGFLSGDNVGPMIWWPGIALRRFNLQIPLWMPLLLIASATAWLWRLDRPPPPPGHCPCGYNLTGLTEPRCPECGQPFEAKGGAP